MTKTSEHPEYASVVTVDPRERLILRKVLPAIESAIQGRPTTTRRPLRRLRKWLCTVLFVDYHVTGIFDKLEPLSKSENEVCKQLGKWLGETTSPTAADIKEGDSNLLLLLEWFCYPAQVLSLPIDTILIMLDRYYHNTDRLGFYRSSLKDISRNRGGQTAIEAKTAVDRDVLIQAAGLGKRTVKSFQEQTEGWREILAIPDAEEDWHSDIVASYLQDAGDNVYDLFMLHETETGEFQIVGRKITLWRRIGLHLGRFVDKTYDREYVREDFTHCDGVTQAEWNDILISVVGDSP